MNEIIELFSEVNPSYEVLFRNKTQRSAVERLLQKIGHEKLEATIQALPRIITQKYAPRITTPLQLESKFGELLIFVKQNGGTQKAIARL